MHSGSSVRHVYSQRSPRGLGEVRRRLHLELALSIGYRFAMSKLELIEAEVRGLPREQVVELQDWLADYLEEAAELKPEFVASIERGQADLRAGRVRVQKG